MQYLVNALMLNDLDTVRFRSCRPAGILIAVACDLWAAPGTGTHSDLPTCLTWSPGTPGVSSVLPSTAAQGPPRAGQPGAASPPRSQPSAAAAGAQGGKRNAQGSLPSTRDTGCVYGQEKLKYIIFKNVKIRDVLTLR